MEKSSRLTLTLCLNPQGEDMCLLSTCPLLATSPLPSLLFLGPDSPTLSGLLVRVSTCCRKEAAKDSLGGEH